LDNIPNPNPNANPKKRTAYIHEGTPKNVRHPPLARQGFPKNQGKTIKKEYSRPARARVITK
jgi:hypothetical protein